VYRRKRNPRRERVEARRAETLGIILIAILILLFTLARTLRWR
jgi:hypothetical protein